MPKYKVLRPIVHNDVAYHPAGANVAETDATQGKHIPTDTSGVIELTDEQAAQMIHGQIEPLKPTPIRRVERPATGVETSKEK